MLIQKRLDTVAFFYRNSRTIQKSLFGTIYISLPPLLHLHQKLFRKKDLTNRNAIHIRKMLTYGGFSHFYYPTVGNMTKVFLIIEKGHISFCCRIWDLEIPWYESVLGSCLIFFKFGLFFVDLRYFENCQILHCA